MEGAQRVFEDFLVQYRPVFASVETYLGTIIRDTPEYAEAYRPWKSALHSLSAGLELAVEQHQLPEDEEFMEALKMFSFDASTRFLEDISENCRMSLGRRWGEEFHAHIEMLALAFTILHQQPKPAPVKIK